MTVVYPRPAAAGAPTGRKSPCHPKVVSFHSDHPMGLSPCAVELRISVLNEERQGAACRRVGSHLPGTLRTVVRGRLYALIMPYMHGCGDSCRQALARG